jgi:mono/diheme cytochrome c family protein
MNRIISTGTLLLAASLVVWILSAGKPASSAQPAADEGPVARLNEAPVSAKSMRNPFARDARAPEAGRKLFLRHCAECHGRDAQGRGRAPALRVPEIRDATPGALFWAIRNGRLRKGMPSWSQLPAAQRWQIVTYLQSLK